MTRRGFLHATAAALPAVGAATGATGLVLGAEEARVPHLTMAFSDLPPDLEGLRILHLSDLHLGYFLHGADLERLFERVSATAPDLIVFTGDVADDLAELEPAMRLAAACKPRYGAFAAIGNHEYYRGIRAVRRIYDRGPVPLLLDGGARVTVGRSTLYVAGVDDPVSLGRHPDNFHAGAFDRALDGAPGDAFTLALCHRPTGFDEAAKRRVPLTLSGHTHGSQIGFAGRSVFEPFAKGKYLRGAYERGASRLYTSAGFGHWFPFRLNCPTEAPLIVLGRPATPPGGALPG